MSILGTVTGTGGEPANNRRNEIIAEMARDEVRRDHARRYEISFAVVGCPSSSKHRKRFLQGDRSSFEMLSLQRLPLPQFVFFAHSTLS